MAGGLNAQVTPLTPTSYLNFTTHDLLKYSFDHTAYTSMSLDSNIEANMANLERAADTGHVNCEGASEELVVELHGLDAETLCGLNIHRDLYPLVGALEQRWRQKLASLLVKHFSSAHSATVLTPSCGANKFSVTLFPVLDAALKLKPNLAELCASWDHLEYTAAEVAPYAYCPSTLIVEPSFDLGKCTLDLLSTLVQDRGLPLTVEGFLDVNSVLLRGRLRSCQGVDIAICTPDVAAELIARSIVYVDGVELTLWDSAHRIFGQPSANVDSLFMQLSRDSRRSIFATTTARSSMIDHVKTSMLRRSRLKSESKFSATIDDRHHHPESFVREWERRTTDPSPINDQSLAPDRSTIAAGSATGSAIAHSISQPLASQPSVSQRAAPQPPAVQSTASATTHSTPYAIVFNNRNPSTTQNPTRHQTRPTTPTIDRPSAAATITPLMGLPFEIRQQIIEYLDLDSDTIEITTFKTRLGAGPSTAARVRGPVGDRFNYRWYALRKRAVRWLSRTPTVNKFAIAQFDKQTARDLLPIIYGHNKFRFNNVSDMNTFLLEIDTNRRFIRQISVRDPCAWNTGIHDYPRVLFSLWPLTNLEYIRFNSLCVGSNVSPGGDRIQIDKLVRHIKPFLQHWHQVREGGTGRSDVLKVVKFIDDLYCYTCMAKSRVCHHGGGTAALEVSRTFKAKIARELGLPAPP